MCVQCHPHNILVVVIVTRDACSFSIPSVMVFLTLSSLFAGDRLGGISSSGEVDPSDNSRE